MLDELRRNKMKRVKRRIEKRCPRSVVLTSVDDPSALSSTQIGGHAKPQLGGSLLQRSACHSNGRVCGALRFANARCRNFVEHFRSISLLRSTNSADATRRGGRLSAPASPQFPRKIVGRASRFANLHHHHRPSTRTCRTGCSARRRGSSESARLLRHLAARRAATRRSLSRRSVRRVRLLPPLPATRIVGFVGVAASARSDIRNRVVSGPPSYRVFDASLATAISVARLSNLFTLPASPPPPTPPFLKAAALPTRSGQGSSAHTPRPARPPPYHLRSNNYGVRLKMGRSRPLVDVDQKIVLVPPSSAASFVVLGRRCVPATFSLSAVAAAEHDDGGAAGKGRYGASAGCPKKTSRRVELTHLAHPVGGRCVR